MRHRNPQWLILHLRGPIASAPTRGLSEIGSPQDGRRDW